MDKKIKEIIQGYGYEIEKQMDKDSHYFYHCINKKSKSEFILDTMYFNSGIKLNYETIAKLTYDSKLVVLYLVLLEEQSISFIERLEEKEYNNMHILIFDEKEEVEYVMKDLWNFIVKFL